MYISAPSKVSKTWTKPWQHIYKYWCFDGLILFCFEKIEWFKIEQCKIDINVFNSVTSLYVTFCRYSFLFFFFLQTCTKTWPRHYGCRSSGRLFCEDTVIPEQIEGEPEDNMGVSFHRGAFWATFCKIGCFTLGATAINSLSWGHTFSGRTWCMAQ